MTLNQKPLILKILVTACNMHVTTKVIVMKKLIQKTQNMAFINNKALDFLRESYEGTHLTLIGRHKHQRFHIKGSLAKEDDAIFYESDVDEKREKGKSQYCKNYVPPVDVKFIIQHSVGKEPTKSDSSGVHEHNYFNNITLATGLDRKKKVAYSVICSSFLLWCLKKGVTI